MANFGFAITGPRRNPTADERANGFPCGEADQLLFNGLEYRTQAELADLIAYAGLTGTDADFTQVRQAILALIAAATGGGDTTSYVLIDQARARLPIFPEFLTSDGKINVTAPATGTIRIPAGVNFLHRGIFPVVTALTDFSTVTSRVYHLRWSPTGGYVLKWLGDSGYNPSALPETDASFDTTYDDMLIARIVTNSSNVATITLLSNRDRLWFNEYKEVTSGITLEGSPGYAAYGDIGFSVDWARAPKHITPTVALGAAGAPGTAMQGAANVITAMTWNRYGVNLTVTSDFDGAISAPYIRSRMFMSA